MTYLRNLSSVSSELDALRPQGVLSCLVEAGAIRGQVLEVGCGDGDNALYLASQGHEVWALDPSPEAVSRARQRAASLGLQVNFIVGGPADAGLLEQHFDTVIDLAAFQQLDAVERAVHVAALRQRTRAGGLLHLLCCSEHEPAVDGLQRLTQPELRRAFAAGWWIIRIDPARYQQGGHDWSAHAWLATIMATDPPARQQLEEPGAWVPVDGVRPAPAA